MNIEISNSNRDNKKLNAVIDGKKTIHCGHAGASDFTKHKDPERKANYISRHSNEDHSKSNVASPAWMSRFILWEQPTLKGAVDNANKKYKDVSFKLMPAKNDFLFK